MTKYHKSSGLSNRYLLFHVSGDQKSKIKELPGLLPSEGYREPVLHVAVSTSGGLLSIFGSPWLQMH